ncbi:MAG: ArnT family glycosyltransferase [Planctomycetota bacterium]
MSKPLAKTDRVRKSAYVAAWVVCVLTILVYLGFKQYSYRPVAGDENIYYYMSKVMAEGKAWPYGDFFFAHPPVQLLVAAGTFKLFGASFAVAKSLSILSAVACGLAIFVIGLRRLGPLEAIVAQGAFLFSFGVLRASSHYTGVNLALALMLWGFYLLLRRHDVAGGVLLALSALTAVYAVPAVMMILFWRLLIEPKRALRAITATIGFYLLVTVIFLIFAGGDYIEGVFTYHLMKKAKALQKWNIISRVFRFHNFFLAWSPVVALLCLLWRRRATQPPDAPVLLYKQLADFFASREGLMAGMLLFVVAYIVWMFQLREWYDFYFMVLFPPLALLAGYVVGEIAAGFVQVFGGGSVFPAVRSLAICLLIGIGYGAVKNSQYEQFFSHRGPDRQPKPQQYTWIDAPHLGSLNRLYRSLFWKDQRDPHGSYMGPTYYLWHEMRHLENLDGAVDYIRGHSGDQDRIFGESGLAPLVAFLADRDIAGFWVDTNTKRFSSGQTSVQALLAEIDVPELRFVIASRTRGKYRFVNRLLSNWLDTNFTAVHQFRSQSNPGITWLVLERRQVAKR